MSVVSPAGIHPAPWQAHLPHVLQHLCQSIQLLLEVTLNAYAQATEFLLFYLASSAKRWDLNLNSIFKCNLFFFPTESGISSPVENISFSKQFEDNVRLSSTDLVKLWLVNACNELIQHYCLNFSQPSGCSSSSMILIQFLFVGYFLAFMIAVQSWATWTSVVY